MRILLGFVFLLTGCHFLQDTAKVAELTQPTGATTEVVDSILGFGEFDHSTPDSIPADMMPDPNVYSINTRIIVEGQAIKLAHDGEKIEAMWWARTIEDVQRDLDIAEKVYEQIGVKFHVSEVSFREANTNILEHFIRANMHPRKMTVVYMLPNSFEWDGYSSGPWEPVNRGIIINYLADEWTLAHEIGHYFGLLHPFDEDYVDDTPEQTMQYCTGEEHSTPNCHNLMNYCDHEPKTVTSGQLERFRRFLRARRLNHYVREYTDVILRGHKFPTPSETNVIFNVRIEKDAVKVLKQDPNSN